MLPNYTNTHPDTPTHRHKVLYTYPLSIINNHVTLTTTQFVILIPSNIMHSQSNKKISGSQDFISDRLDACLYLHTNATPNHSLYLVATSLTLNWKRVFQRCRINILSLKMTEINLMVAVIRGLWYLQNEIQHLIKSCCKSHNKNRIFREQIPRIYQRFELLLCSN